MENNLSVNVANDFGWLESELSNGNGQFLVGDSITAADIVMGFSIDFIFTRRLGTKAENWPMTKKYLDGLLQRDSYKKAVQKTGFSL
jgi:glutathione S-transferase